MNTLHVEYLMNHKLGLAQSYMKPTEEALLTDYLKAVPSLTISDKIESALLQKQVAELAEKNEEQNYIIKGKLSEKEKEYEELEAKMDIMMSNVASLMEHLTSGGKESVDLIGLNGEAIDASKHPEEESKQQLFRAAAIARARNEARIRGNNNNNSTKTFLMNARVKEEEPPPLQQQAHTGIGSVDGLSDARTTPNRGATKFRHIKDPRSCS
jgi:hypothetical protein